MKSRESKYGMTLVEMLIVVALIAMLATIVIGIAARIGSQAKEKGLQNIFSLLESALQEYYEYWNVFPDPNKPPYLTRSAALYGQLQATPSSRKILENIDSSLIKNNPAAVDMPQIYDVWGILLDYRYVPGDTFPELISAGPDRKFHSPGPDGRFGTPDDVISSDDISSKKKKQ
jgi:prepilin-type N-terminal cleavage/methylation domain-containing protein